MWVRAITLSDLLLMSELSRSGTESESSNSAVVIDIQKYQCISQIMDNFFKFRSFSPQIPEITPLLSYLRALPSLPSTLLTHSDLMEWTCEFPSLHFCRYFDILMWTMTWKLRTKSFQFILMSLNYCTVEIQLILQSPCCTLDHKLWYSLSLTWDMKPQVGRNARRAINPRSETPPTAVKTAAAIMPGHILLEMCAKSKDLSFVVSSQLSVHCVAEE